MADRFTSNDVAALTGISLRQLQWWDERGLVVPAREGHRRLYSQDDIAEVAVIAELRQKGFSLQRMRKVVRFLRQELGRGLVETVSGGSDYHLLTDGRRIYVENSAQQVIDVLKNARQPMFAVCLSDAVRRVHPKLHGRRSANSARPATPTRAKSARAGDPGGGRGTPLKRRVAAKLRA
jgi:DNA-binding transcriptional MerR regulator